MHFNVIQTIRVSIILKFSTRKPVHTDALTCRHSRGKFPRIPYFVILCRNYGRSVKLQTAHGVQRRNVRVLCNIGAQFCISPVTVVLSRSTWDRLKPGRTWTISANRMINYGTDNFACHALFPPATTTHMTVRSWHVALGKRTSTVSRMFSRFTFICTMESLLLQRD